MNRHTPTRSAALKVGVFLLCGGIVRFASSAFCAAIFSFLARSSKYFVIVVGSFASDFIPFGSGGASGGSAGESASLKLYGFLSVAHSSSSSTATVAGDWAGDGAAGVALV